MLIYLCCYINVLIVKKYYYSTTGKVRIRCEQEQSTIMLHTVTFITLVFFVIAILSTIGIIVGMRLYNNLKNEKHQEQGKVIQRILKTYAIVQCIGWPCMMIFVGLLLIDRFVTNFVDLVVPASVCSTSAMPFS